MENFFTRLLEGSNYIMYAPLELNNFGARVIVCGLEGYMQLARFMSDTQFCVNTRGKDYRRQIEIMAANVAYETLGERGDRQEARAIIRRIFLYEMNVRPDKSIKNAKFDGEKCPVRYLGVGKYSLTASNAKSWTKAAEAHADTD